MNSWQLEQWARLARLERDDKKILEKDLADMFVEYLNAQHRLSLRWGCAPDQADRRRPSPDCIYADAENSVSMALEITRLYSEKRQESYRHWRDLCGRLNKRLSCDIGGAYYYLVITEGARACADADVCRDAASRLAALAPGQGCDLGSLFGGHVRAERLLGVTEGVVLEPVLLEAPEGFATKYQSNLVEANSKLRHWRERGYETFLLYDARLRDSLNTCLLQDLKSWHGIAHTYAEKGFGDPTSDGPCPFVHSDFSEIDHICVLELDDRGVVATSLWKHDPCGIPPPALPDQWTIVPADWHDD